MHCLKVVRRAFRDNEQNLQQGITSGHIYHCLDSIRQDLMCKADDTPMPLTHIDHSLGDGQITKCRNWDQLIAWTQAPERNACHRLISDYREIHHKLERYQYCPKDSEYSLIVEAYFEKFGHKNPYVE